MIRVGFHRVYHVLVELRHMAIQKAHSIDYAEVQEVGECPRDRNSEVIRHSSRRQPRENILGAGWVDIRVMDMREQQRRPTAHLLVSSAPDLMEPGVLEQVQQLLAFEWGGCRQEVLGCELAILACAPICVSCEPDKDAV